MGENAAVSQTTAAKKTMPCKECENPLASKQSLTNHVFKTHIKVVTAVHKWGGAHQTSNQLPKPNI